MSAQRGWNAGLWARVVTVAGIGSSLEWFDFYIYTQLSDVITKVFFPSTDSSIAALSYWAVFAAGFIVRPIGALVFGHVADEIGRNRSLVASIATIAAATVVIGVLPGYGTPASYSIGIAAPILLALLRMVQGLALGGEYCVAVIYISELAPLQRRGLYVGLMMTSVNIGLVLATVFVMVLTAALTEGQMLSWGWRLPFLCAALTSLLGYYVRKGMPEPQPVAHARQMLKDRRRGGLPIKIADTSVKGGEAGAAAAAAADTAAADAAPAGETANGAARPSSDSASCSSSSSSSSDDGDEAADVDASMHAGRRSPTGIIVEAPGGLDKGCQVHLEMPDRQQQELDEAEEQQQRALEQFSYQPPRLPLVRVLRGNLPGLLLHVMYIAWVACAFYTAVSWGAVHMKELGVSVLHAQAMMVVSLLFNAAGVVAVGLLLDRGMQALGANAAVVALGVPLAFGTFYGLSGTNLGLNFVLVSLFQLVVGVGMGLAVLPCSRIYSTLERSTGFSFGYNLGYGVLGGLSPLIITSIQHALPEQQQQWLAAALWLAAMGALSAVGIALLLWRIPRLNRACVGRLV